MKKKPLETSMYIPKGERNGILLFLFISLVIILGSKRYIAESGDEVKIVSGSSETETTEFGLSGKKLRHKKQKSMTNPIREKHIFVFNPNHISFDSLKLLGFSDFAAKNLVNYRKKGGKFKNPDQLFKIYGTDSLLLSSLKSNMIFRKEPPQKADSLTQSETRERDFSEKKPEIPQTFTKIELNTADSIQLVSIKGIGPYFAKKIIKMRQKLGGYASVNQLSECKVLPDSVVQKISMFVFADESKMEKINLNQASYKTIIQHPYFDENLVKVILNYRENHGNFTSLQQLKNIKIFNKEKYEKIVKHLKI